MKRKDRIISYVDVKCPKCKKGIYMAELGDKSVLMFKSKQEIDMNVEREISTGKDKKLTENEQLLKEIEHIKLNRDITEELRKEGEIKIGVYQELLGGIFHGFINDIRGLTEHIKNNQDYWMTRVRTLNERLKEGGKK